VRDPIEGLLELSRRIGSDPDLTQASGGNTSVKIGGTLLVKAGGASLGALGREDLVELDLAPLAGLRARSDEEMVRAIRRARLRPGERAEPSVETPLHSLLPYRFVAHTHDVRSMAVTDRADARAQSRRVWGDEVAFVPYARPGVPLARRISETAIGASTRGLALEKHGFVAWGKTADECWENLKRLLSRAPLPPPLRVGGSWDRAAALELLPRLRGAASRPSRVVLHFDPDLVTEASDLKIVRWSMRGMATPEHMVRAGARPEILRRGKRLPRAKTVLIPGVGVATQGASKSEALAANACFRATLRVIRANGGRFRSVTPQQAREIERWPLVASRMKEAARRERPMQRIVAAVVGMSEPGLQREGANVVTGQTADPSLFDRAVLEYGGLDMLICAWTGAEAAEAAARQAVSIMKRQGLGGRLIYVYTAGQAAPQFAREKNHQISSLGIEIFAVMNFCPSEILHCPLRLRAARF
jgi:rhamnose utilization protein RhaD (predicted bifunctional aldolase and dehydrogenase)